ncbi:MAG: hypothetical protein ACO3O0_00460 [Bacteroidia bacterium]
MVKGKTCIKGAAISLCGVLLLQLGGWFFLTKSVIGVGQIRQYWTTSHGNPVLFVFSSNHFDRIIEGEDEFIHKGSFYDIQSVQQLDGLIHVTAVQDSFEGGMLAFFNAFSGHEKDASKQLKFPPGLKFILPAKIKPTTSLQISAVYYPTAVPAIALSPNSISTPPPESFFV